MHHAHIIFQCMYIPALMRALKERAIHLVSAPSYEWVPVIFCRHIIKRIATNAKLPARHMLPLKSDGNNHLYWDESKAPDIGPLSNEPNAVKAKHMPIRAPSSDKSGVNTVTSGTNTAISWILSARNYTSGSVKYTNSRKVAICNAYHNHTGYVVQSYHRCDKDAACSTGCD